MMRFPRWVPLGLLLLLGTLGCTQGSSPTAAKHTAALERIKALEAKNNRLEEDFRNTSTARDQLRRKLRTTEETQAQLQAEIEQLRCVMKERDDARAEREGLRVERDQLREQIKSFAGERDALQAEFQQIQKSLKTVQQLMSQSNSPAIPVGTLTSQVGE